MTDERWQRMVDWAARNRANPTFDRSDREYRLEIARAARAALEAAERGEAIGEPIASLLALMKRGRLPKFVRRPHRAALTDWTAGDDRTFAAALRAFSVDAPQDGVARLAEAAKARMAADEADAFALAIGSIFAFALAPERLPIMRLDVFNGLERIFEAPAPPGSAPEGYEHHLAFARRLHDAHLAAGIDVRDMVDTEALMLMGWEDHEFWVDAEGDVRKPRTRMPDHYLAACVLYRDEAPYLAEWLEFHLLVGFERFYLYDNESVDEHREVLAPYIDEGIVVLREWPRPYVPGQREAYEHCVATHWEEVRWIAFLDVDEFFFSPTYRPVSELLTEYEQWPGVVVNTPQFGTSGHITRPTGLVIENYVTRLLRDADRTIKSVVDPAAVESATAHNFSYLRRSAVDENGYPAHHHVTKTASFRRLRINHYYWKSVEELAERQTGRRAGPARAGRRPRDADETARYEAEHGVRDETILPYVEAVREALARRNRSR